MKVLRYVLVAVLAANCSSETAGPNRAPVAVAGSDRVAAVDEIVTFNGSGSYDPDGDSLIYRWTLVAGPGAAELSAERAVSVGLTPDVMGVWVVRLGVSDGKLESDPDVVQVRVFGGPPCTTDEDCDDGLYCNGSESCVSGRCAPGTPVDCSDGDACTQDVCNEDLNLCENPPVTQAPETEGPVGDATCTDGADNDCDGMTDGSDPGCIVCSSDAECDDHNECTNDRCESQACVNEAVTDGTECGERSCSGLDWMRRTCVSGACTGSDLVMACDDGRDCTTDECDVAGGCTHAALADGSECGARYCDGLEHKRQTCLSGVCSDSDLLSNCDDTNDCTADTCDGANGCNHANLAEGTECGARYCSGLEWRRQTCRSGQCNSNGLETDCDDANVCTDDSCNAAGGCTNMNNTANCDDGDACTMGDVCANGSCAGVPLDADGDNHIAEGCPGGDDCDDSRDNVHPGIFEGSAFDWICRDGLDNDCDGLTDADDDTCQQCTHDSDCDDDDVCNGVETCVGVICQAGTPLICDDGIYCNGQETCDAVSGCQTATNPCAETECNHCNETDGNCFDPAGTACTNDGLYCTGVEECNGAGSCESSGSPCAETECNHCDDTADNCFDPAGTACTDDGLYCTGAEECDGSGACLSSGSPCAEMECNTCQESTDSCFDPAGTVCDDTLYCNGIDECDGIGGCTVHSGDPCLPSETCDEDGDTCLAGVCTADADCPPGDLCWPTCSPRVDGCVTPPGSLTMVCRDPVILPVTDVSNCTITLAGGDNLVQADCLTCTTEVGVTLVDVADFDDGGGSCYPSGWNLVPSTPNLCKDHADNCEQGGGDRACCDEFATICETATFGQPVMVSDKRDNCGGGVEEFRMYKSFSLSGLTDAWVCFDLGDRDANDNEGLLVYVDGPGNPQPQPEQIYCHNGKVEKNVNDFLYNTCANLPDWTNGVANVMLSFIVHSNDNDDMLFLDNIVLKAWGGGCAPTILTPLDEGFDTPSECDTTGWSFSNNDWDCPGFDCNTDPEWSPGIEANGASFTMDTVLDASDLDGEVKVCFQLGFDGTVGADTLGLFYDAGSGWQQAWRQTGQMGPDGECREICVNLSDIDANVNNNPGLGLRFDFDSSNGKIDVYRVTVTGARYCPAADTVVALSSPPVGDGAGNYKFTATDTYGRQLDADIMCEWDADTGLNVMDTVHYKNRLGRFIKRRRLTFDNGSRSENLQGFPVLVTLDVGWFDYSQTRSAGEDLRFLDSDDFTVLAHEIERWDESGTSYIWVKVPQINAWDDTDYIWMYYGNEDAPDRQRPAAVWTAGYVAVWHLNETAADEATTATHYDSTANDNDGTQNRSQSADGFISGGQYFDGDNDYIEVPGTGLQIAGNEITIEAWARPTGEPNDYCHVVGAGSDGRYWQLWWNSNWAGWHGWHGRLRVNGGMGGMFTNQGDYDAWNYLALLYDGVKRRLYWNAVEIDWESASGNLDATNSVFLIGDNPNLSPRDFQGYIDEVRISNIYRTDEWLDAQYASMRDSLITYGPEENP